MAIKNEIVLFTSSDKPNLKIEVRFEDETVWLTQAQIAELFDVKRPAITKHISNIFKADELNEDSTCSILEHMGSTGTQKYKIKYYNLDVILSIGYRVNSKNATQFRIWANQILKDYLLKGYVISKRVDRLEEKLIDHDKKFDLLLNTTQHPKEGIFYDGQVFDAYQFVSKLIKSAKKSIILIDNYIDESVLTLLSKRSKSVNAIIYTTKISKQLQLDIDKFNAQYKRIDVKVFKQSHDRFLIIDRQTVYHIGASLKDLGKKWFAFSKINLNAQEIINKLKS